MVVPASAKPPLDPRILSNVIANYDGERLQVPECESPVYHGHGHAVFRTGFQYKGEFVNGRMHGNGRIEWKNGVVYEGELMENEITGVGTYRWPNGSSYTGEVVKGKRHGTGTFVAGSVGSVPSIDAATQELAFTFSEDLELHFSVQSAARYEGQWVNGLPHGTGVLIYDDHLDIRYEGAFAYGKRHGRGQMRYASGDVYDGLWEHDVKSGQGVMHWHSVHETYEGEWHNDQQHGSGRHVWTHAKQKEVNWYEGTFVCGLREGYGVFYYANGARYEGEWQENLKHGAGAFFYDDGRVFCGEFVHDRPPPAMETTNNDSIRLVLYLQDIVKDDPKVQKAVENAALRMNSDLRALYRQYTEDSAMLLELHDCCRLLGDCGVHKTRGQVESLLLWMRQAQRHATVGLQEDGTEKKQRSSSAIVDILAHDRLMLYREFVELIVRLAHDQRLRDGDLRLPLADEFTSLCEAMVRERTVTLQKPPMSLLHQQIYSKEMQLVLRKHQPQLCRRYAPHLTVRTLLRLVRDPPLAWLSVEFGVRQALQTLAQLLATTNDPFLLDLTLSYSEFVDALVVMLHHKAPSASVPLHLLVHQQLMALHS